MSLASSEPAETPAPPPLSPQAADSRKERAGGRDRDRDRRRGSLLKRCALVRQHRVALAQEACVALARLIAGPDSTQTPMSQSQSQPQPTIEPQADILLFHNRSSVLSLMDQEGKSRPTPACSA